MIRTHELVKVAASVWLILLWLGHKLTSLKSRVPTRQLLETNG